MEVWRFLVGVIELGLRPFGVSFIYGGWDEVYGFQLYQSDPSGNYGGWKATCIGANSNSAQSMLKQDYKEDLSLHDAAVLALKIMGKSMDSTTLSSDKRKKIIFFFLIDLVEMALIKRVDDKTVIHQLKTEQIDPYLKEANEIVRSEATA